MSTNTNTYTEKAVIRSRILFLSSLVLMAIGLGVLTYYVLEDTETDLARQLFLSLSSRATAEAARNFRQQGLAALSMASVISWAFPNESDWPLAAVHGFEEISSKIVAASNSQELALVPIILPAEKQEFEEFAYDWLHTSRLPKPFPETTGVSSFGKGIWEPDPSNPREERISSNSTDTRYGSPYQIFAPLFQTTRGAHPQLMFQMHSDRTQGEAIDAVIRCTEIRAETQDGSSECIFLSSFARLPGLDPVNDGPGAVLYSPLFPASASFSLVGFLASRILWKEVLVGIVDASVSGVHAVVRSGGASFTFLIVNGIPAVVGPGDSHDQSFDYLGVPVALIAEPLSESSANYTLTFYPTSLFFEVYSTGNPLFAAIGASCFIILTSLLFILYDFYVRRAFLAKDDLLEAKREFMRFVSHEVRTPMNSVNLGAKLLSGEMQANISALGSEESQSQKISEWLTLVDTIRTNTEAAVDVLDELLQWDKIVAGKLQLQFGEIDIGNLLRSTTEEFSVMAQEKHVTLKTAHIELDTSVVDLEVGSQTKIVVGDSVRLVQCFRNLISNALKFSPNGGMITIESRFKKRSSTTSIMLPKVTQAFTLEDGSNPSYECAGSVQIKVSDQGVGLSKEHLSSLFGDGVQFSQNTHQEGRGSGLGLYVTKGLIEQHQGSLSAYSEGLGKGTTFTVELPFFTRLTSKEAYFQEDRREISISEIEEAKERRPKSLKILVVDDAAMNRKLLSRLLEKSGHVCEQAADGDEACRIVKESEEVFDTILMDKEMPSCDGPTAVKRLRSMGCDCLIIGLTGSVLPEDVDIFTQSGTDHILAKPFKQEELESLWTQHGLQ